MPMPPKAPKAIADAIVETPGQVLFDEALVCRELHVSRARLGELMGVVGAEPLVTEEGHRLWHWLAIEAAVLAATWPQLKWTPRKMRAAIAWVYGLKRDMKTRRVHEQLKAIGSHRKRSRKRGDTRRRRSRAAAVAGSGGACPVAFADDCRPAAPGAADSRGGSRRSGGERTGDYGVLLTGWSGECLAPEWMVDRGGNRYPGQPCALGGRGHLSQSDRPPAEGGPERSDERGPDPEHHHPEDRGSAES